MVLSSQTDPTTACAGFCLKSKLHMPLSWLVLIILYELISLIWSIINVTLLVPTGVQFTLDKVLISKPQLNSVNIYHIDEFIKLITCATAVSSDVA